MNFRNFRNFWNTNKILFYAGFVALIVTLSTQGVFRAFFTENKKISYELVENTPYKQVANQDSRIENNHSIDFTAVADNVMETVVHIKSSYVNPDRGAPFDHKNYSNPFEEFFKGDPFEEFFGPRYFYRKDYPDNKKSPNMRVGQGSGVIISQDGYIVTNNHVVANAAEIEVTLFDNRTYRAKMVGSDPSTDLALLQIKEKGLPRITFANSDQVKIGEWVMAVGNPFNLTSTVTAGIVSAKARNINILKDQFAVESFIQTDAAINPGNSGGALVNLEGKLIGINTAIASPTGAYSGYGFAVPTNIVSKVVEDLMNYGIVQRGVLGVMIRTVDGTLKKNKNLDVNEGAYVDSLTENSAAAAAGIRVGDVIIAVDDLKIEGSPELQEAIARHRPGDKVNVKINRKGNEKVYAVTLNNRKGGTDLVSREHRKIMEILGVELELVESDFLKEHNVDVGLKVKKLSVGKLRNNTSVQEGFIILKVNGERVDSIDDFVKKIENKEGGVMLEGIYEDIPGTYYYAFGMDQ